MSGGVDSAVVAGLLKRRGHDVVGVTMQIWQESQTDPRHSGCCSIGAVEDARRAASLLDIPHYVVNYKDTFRKTVIEPFMDSYANGETPNPCVECNRHVKFSSLMETMRQLGGSALATGHYARVRWSPRTNSLRLMQARAGTKDQSYVLYMLESDHLTHVRFPLGELASKSDTRQLAAEWGLLVADKPDSQEICFVSEDGGYAQFLKGKKPELFESGEVVDVAGNVLGTHSGSAGFTVGQRRGIGLTVGSGRPLYVIDIQAKENRVVVGEEELLLRKEVPLREICWHERPELGSRTRVYAKIRYNMQPQPAYLYAEPTPRLEFCQPVRAVTPGQIAVAYRGRTVVAGGVIDRT